MNQQALFHDTIYEALKADVAAIGGTKETAGKLWPSENPVTASAKLRNALNPEQAHKLTAEELLRIKRLAAQAGSYAAINFESQQLGYRVEWIDPEDEQEQLDREIRDLLQVVLRKQEARERASARAGLQAVPR